MAILADPMLDDLEIMSSTVNEPYPPWSSCSGRPINCQWPRSQSKMSVKLTTFSFKAAEMTTILNVEPGSAVSAMMRFRIVSISALLGWFGS